MLFQIGIFGPGKYLADQYLGWPSTFNFDWIIVKVNYTVEYLEREPAGRTHILNELRAIKSEFNITQQVVVEFGCGIGSNLVIFKETNAVIGIDGLEDVAPILKSAGIQAIFTDLNKRVPLEDSSVDWVLCIDVLEHLTDPDVALAEIRRVLRPGGRAIVNVPNHLNLSGRLKLLFGSNLDVHKYFPDKDDWNNPHIRFFTYSGFLRLIQTVGLTILSDRSKNFATFPFASRIPFIAKGAALKALARDMPGIFAGGFFMILERN